jgi:hypothetical protein
MKMEPKKYYEITGEPTEELVEKFNKDNNIFFRFQNPEWELTPESKSWGMIYGSEEEALESAEEDGLTEEEAVLPGKSCMDTLQGLWNWADQFDNNNVVLVFEGDDTGVNGHDDEYVAEFIKPVAVWSIEDCYNYLYGEN